MSWLRSAIAPAFAALCLVATPAGAGDVEGLDADDGIARESWAVLPSSDDELVLVESRAPATTAEGRRARLLRLRPFPAGGQRTEGRVETDCKGGLRFVADGVREDGNLDAAQRRELEDVLCTRRDPLTSPWLSHGSLDYWSAVFLLERRARDLDFAPIPGVLERCTVTLDAADGKRYLARTAPLLIQPLSPAPKLEAFVRSRTGDQPTAYCQPLPRAHIARDEADFIAVARELAREDGRQLVVLADDFQPTGQSDPGPQEPAPAVPPSPP